eukprot:PhF_6_TR3930/c0_g2_i1/m.5504
MTKLIDVEVCLGHDDNFPTDRDIVFRANGTALAPFTMTTRIPIVSNTSFVLRPLSSAPVFTKAMEVTAKSVEALVMTTGLVNAGGATTMQTTILLSMMTCMPESIRGLTNQSLWTFGPLSSVTPSMFDNVYPNIIFWNVVLLLICGTLHGFVIGIVIFLKQRGEGGGVVGICGIMSTAQFPRR